MTALCSAQACGTTYSILIDEHDRIVSHTRNIPNIIKDKEQLKGKMIIAFTLDLNEMKEQFLKRYENSMKKSYVKWENEEAWSLFLIVGNNKEGDIQ